MAISYKDFKTLFAAVRKAEGQPATTVNTLIAKGNRMISQFEKERIAALSDDAKLTGAAGKVRESVAELRTEFLELVRQHHG